jgi:hypothetical protein
VQKAAEKGLAAAKAQIKDDPKAPAEVKELIKAARAFLDAVKVNSSGNKATAEITADSALLIKTLVAVFTATDGVPGKPVENPKVPK